MTTELLQFLKDLGPFASAIATIIIFGIITRRRDQKKKAIDLLETLMTEESMVRSRLVIQEYLVPGVNRRKYARFHGMSFEEINDALEIGSDQEQRDRVDIRAIPSFFWLVNEAAKNGVIQKDAGLWSRIYSYYWVFVIEPRRATSKDIFYQFFSWMVDPKDIEDRRKEYAQRVEKAMIREDQKAI